MNTIISARNFILTEAIKESLDKKLSVIEKFIDPNTQVKMVMETKKFGQKIEVSVLVKNRTVRAEAIDENLYNAIDMVVEKLKRQIEKASYKKEVRSHHTPTQNKHHDKNEDMINGRIVKRKIFDMKPMMEEEAILQMELLGHEFFVFFNAEIDEVCVVYKRRDGNYGLIEREI